MNEITPNTTETTIPKEADMALDTTTTTPAATPALIQRGTATVQFNGLTANVGFDIHADAPMDMKEELIRMAALRCASDFADAYRVGPPKPAIEEGEAA